MNVYICICIKREVVECFLEFKKNYEELLKQTQQSCDEKIADMLAEIEVMRKLLNETITENGKLDQKNKDLEAENDKLKKMLRAMGKQKKMNVEDVMAKMKLNSNLNVNSLGAKNEDYDKIVIDNYLFHIIKVP